MAQDFLPNTPALPADHVDRRAILTVDAISKRYRRVQALNDVSLNLHSGEVLGLVGDNGAGKSTLIGILSGAVAPTHGQIRLGDHVANIRSPLDARALGIETVYQDLALAKDLTAWQNVFLGREETKRGLLGKLGWLDRKAMKDRAAREMADIGIKLPSSGTLSGRLSGGQRQTVAMARAVTWGTKILLLDEPTSALGPEEQARVFAIVRSLADSGMAVLLVSQNLPKVREVSDRIVVLRLGQVVAEVARDCCSLDELIGYITGVTTHRPAAATAAKRGKQGEPNG